MRRFMSYLLVFIFVLTPLAGVVLADGGPKFSITGSTSPTIYIGQNNTISFVLNNSGTEAKNVTLTPDFQKAEGISSGGLTTDSINLGDIASGNISSVNKTVSLNLFVSSDVKEGRYPITLKFKIDGKELEKYEPIIYVYVKTKPDPGPTPDPKPDTSRPAVVISKTVTSPRNIYPESSIKLTLHLENKSNITANNISVKLENLNPDGGFYINTGSDVAYLQNLYSNTNTVDFYLKSSKNIKKGIHELKATFTYGDITETQLIYLDVKGDDPQGSNLIIENLSYPTRAIKPNGEYLLKFDLRNNGEISANNITIKVESSDPAVVPKTTNYRKITSIKDGKKESLEFIFFPTDQAATQNYPLNISVEYEDEFNQNSETKYKINQYAGIYVDNPDVDSTKGKPRLIIDKYTFEPQLVRAGENFDMTLSFFNTSSNKTVRNIKIFLTAEPGSDMESAGAGSSAFTPVDSSNTFYIDSIAPKGRVTKRITMYTIPDAIAKTHTITASFEYEDNDGTPLDDKELIGVPVIQNARLETGEIGYYPEAYVGQPMPISLEFYNTGKVALYNMMVKLEGDFQTENGSSYIGNFATGSSEYFEGMVIPTEMGELNGAVLFTYEDSTGQMQELRKEFTLNVMDMPFIDEEYPDDFPPFDEGKEGILKSKWFWISLVSILLIAGGIVFYKKKKKAKELAFDE